jgi:CarD family transcriptional regulator
MATKGKVKNKAKTSAKTTQAKKPAKKNNATPASKKQSANTKKVATKVAAKSSAKSSVKPGMKKLDVKNPAAKAQAPVQVKASVPQPKAPVPQQAKAPMNHGRPMNMVSRAPVHAVITPSVIGKKGFAVGEHVVYPTHGVGKILGLESEKIGEYELKVFVIAFEKDKMTLRVPVGRAEAAGLRSISPMEQINRALATLKGRAKIARGMWSRRAQEYEAKINSGNLVQIAEVVRDLHKNVDQSERSYSERMIYETAMHRLCGEVAASERVDIKDAQDKLLKVLRKQAAAQAAA